MGAYNAGGFETPDSDDYRMTAEQINRIRAELEAGERRQREAQQASSSSATSDLSVATSQSLPAGVPIHSMATDEEEEEMPPLETPTEVAEEEEEEEDDETQQIMEILDGLKMNQSVKAGIKFDLNKMNLNDWSSINPTLIKRDTLMTMFKIADSMGRLNNEEKETFEAINQKLRTTEQDTPERKEAMEEARNLFINAFHKASDDDETHMRPQSRKHKETIDYNRNIDRWKRSDVSVDDLLFQLHLRGIQLTEEQQEEMSKLKIKGKGKNPTQKDYSLTYVQRLMVTDKWADEVNDQLLKSRKEEWVQMKKGKGKGVIRKAFESAGSSLLEAGKEVAKDALIAGAQNAIMSLL